MNPPAETNTDSKAIRSQIDETRHRMDAKLDALGERFTGRHLVDEALHFFRTQTDNGNMNKFKQTLTRSADVAVHSVVDTVKANPVPALLIGAGVAWYLYNQNRGMSAVRGTSFYDENEPGYGYYSGQYPAEVGGELHGHADRGEGLGDRIKEKAGELRERSRDTLHSAGERVHEFGEDVRERAHEITERLHHKANDLGQRSRQLYRDGRQRVASTIEQHPLESGLMCLAFGLIAGVALPTSRRVRRTVAPTARELQHRASEMAQRGRVVIRTAAEAAKKEAEAQGLTRTSASSGRTDTGPRPVGDALREVPAQAGLGQPVAPLTGGNQ